MPYTDGVLVQVRDLIEPARLLHAAATALGLKPELLHDLQSPGSPDAVYYQLAHFPEGFRSMLELFLTQSPLDSLGLARELAKAFHCDCLVSPHHPTDVLSPYVWLLVRPTGQVYVASEQMSDDDEDPEGPDYVDRGIEIDYNQLIPMTEDLDLTAIRWNNVQRRSPPS